MSPPPTGGNGKSLRSKLTLAALGETMVKFASTYLLTRDREFQVSAKRLIGAMSVIFQEVQKGEKIQEVVAKNLFARAELLIRENHGKSEDERHYAWTFADFVIELNHAFRIECDDDAIHAWRRRLLLIAFEGDFTRNTALVSVERGLFLADPELEDWASSGVAGFIHMTRGILPLVEKYSASAAYDKLDNPSPARAAMNEEFLNDIRASDGRDGAGLAGGPRGNSDQAGAASDPLRRASTLLAIMHLDEDTCMSDSQRERAKAGACIKGGRQSDKKEAWDRMKAAAMWKPVVRQWGRKAPYYYPAVCAGADLGALFPDMDNLAIPIGTVFPEKVNLDRLNDYVRCPERKRNHHALLKHLRAAQAGAAGVRKQGRSSQDDLEVFQAWSRHEQSLKSTWAAANQLLEEHQGGDGALQVKYHFSAIGDLRVRCRRRAEGTASQSLSKQIQTIVQPDVVKLDWRKCFLTLAPQVMKRMKIILNGHSSEQGSAIEAVAAWPDIDAKKTLALSVLFGKKNAGDQYQAMERDARVLRWAASSALPDVFQAAVEDERDNPELTCVSRLLEGAEDACTEALVKFVLEKRGSVVSHLAWEFDGIGVNVGVLEDAHAFITDAENYVHKETGYKMHLAAKKERSLLETLVASGQQLPVDDGPGGPDQLASYFTEGNCIQAAVVASCGCGKPALPAPEANSRSYREVAEHFEINLHGACVLDVLFQLASGRALDAGDYLLHSEPGGEAHCVLLRASAVVQGENGPEQTFDLIGTHCGHEERRSKCRVSAVEFCRAIGGAADKRLAVLFRINGSMARSTDALMDLEAGASASPPVDVQLPLAAAEPGGVDVGLLSDCEEDADEPDEPTFMEMFCNVLGKEAADYQVEVGGCRSRTQCRCLLCPWRSFSRREHLIEHQKHHRPPKFVASREDDALFKVAMSLYRFDRVCSVLNRAALKDGGYLARAAGLLRDWNRDAPADALQAACHSNEAHLVFVFTEAGPRYWLRAKCTDCIRINSKISYTKGFEDSLISLALVSHGAMNGVLGHLHRQWSRDGTSPFLACRPQLLREIMDHVFRRPDGLAQLTVRRLMGEEVARGEFTALTHDGTFKFLFSVIGQKKMDQKKGGIYVGHTLMGMTGACSGFSVQPDESTESFGAAVRERLTPAAIEQVRMLYSDAPSENMVEHLPRCLGVAQDRLRIALRAE